MDTPTPVPGISVQLDCDVSTAGIQASWHTVPLDAGIVDVDVVLVNNGPAFTLAGAMNFNVDHPSVARLDAQPSPPCAGPGVECNPDFNELALTGGTWSCAPPFPDDDTDGGPSERSFLSCYNNVDAEPVAAGESLTLATVHYDIAAGATVGGPEGLTLNAVNLFNEVYVEKFACGPGVGPCFNAAVSLGPPAGLPTVTPTPTATATPPPPPPSTPQSASSPASTPSAPAFVALDCALSIPGIQSKCTYLTSDTYVDVGVVFVRRAGYGEERWGQHRVRSVRSRHLSPLPTACNRRLRPRPESRPDSGRDGWSLYLLGPQSSRQRHGSVRARNGDIAAVLPVGRGADARYPDRNSRPRRDRPVRGRLRSDARAGGPGAARCRRL